MELSILIDFSVDMGDPQSRRIKLHHRRGPPESTYRCHVPDRLPESLGWVRRKGGGNEDSLHSQLEFIASIWY